MKKTNFEFPVICFWNKFVRLSDSYDNLTHTTKAGVKNGMFKDLLIVDSSMMAFRVIDAKKAHGIGLFGGWSIFLNQRIRVDLEIQEEPKIITLDEVKQKVLLSFSDWHGWASGGNLQELKRRVQMASSLGELASILK